MHRNQRATKAAEELKSQTEKKCKEVNLTFDASFPFKALLIQK